MSPTKVSKVKEASIEDTYKKKTLHEHILTIPDTYIGSTDPETTEMWVYDEGSKKMVKREITYVPGLYKTYDEVLVNARDHANNFKSCNTIKIDISDTEISVWNNGPGIPVQVHDEYKIHVPELIFGNLLTSTNYDKKGKTTGGKNGYGAKLANIYSTSFKVETLDTKVKKLYKQSYSENMYKIGKPKITDSAPKAKSYTKITFSPDFPKFGLTNLTEDIKSLLKKRAFDIAASECDHVKVYLNGELIKLTGFEDYVKMFYEEEPTMVYDTFGARWKVGVVYDPSAGFTQQSFVNGISTFRGGSHVNHVETQIVGGVLAHIKNKHKSLNIKFSQIKENLTFFINCVIEDPGFDSQIKNFLSTKVADFGSRCEIPETFIKLVAKTGLEDAVVDMAKLKALQDMKKSDGTKRESIRDVEKVEDADWAGTRKSKHCSLFLTEGDSAATFAEHGLSVLGSQKYGYFPLKGKLLNVRDAKPKQLLDNEEIKNIKKILGLKQGKKYTDVSQLRYGSIIILTDQDVDGSHIKGLLMNFIHFFWPSLIKMKGFIKSLKTPIVKAFKKSDKKKNNPKVFYTLTDYENWMNGLASANGWDIKYYKGLATSSEKEAKKMFREEFEKNLITYVWTDKQTPEEKEDDESDKDEDGTDALDDEGEEVELEEVSEGSASSTDYEMDNSENALALKLGFSKFFSDKRKTWLGGYNKNVIIENTTNEVTYHDFIHKELIHFSNYDNIRSVPSVCDGLKPSQRKIVFGSYIAGIERKEMKVANLASIVSDKAGYHHGEASLQGAIVGMAQNFVGSNNVNILAPNGGFGTRRVGGKDAGSARYIFTQFTDNAQKLFRREDEPVYTYCEEEGDVVEPTIYAPILPLILMNGTKGIGTGYSTDVPCFNPKDIAANIKRLMKKEEPIDMTPWYHRFIGQIVKVKDNHYQSKGIIDVVDEDTVHIRELPVGVWTNDYKKFLDSITIVGDKKPTKTKFVVKYNRTGMTTNRVSLYVTLAKGELQKLIKSGELEKKFRLVKNFSTTNMHLYDVDGMMRKYGSVTDILRAYYDYRLKIYVKRKAHYIELLTNEMLLLKYKVKFIKGYISGKIKLNNVAEEQIFVQLEKQKFPKLSTNLDATEDQKSYGYLINMTLRSLTKEKIIELEKQFEDKQQELEEYANTPPETLWSREIDEFLKTYNKWLLEFNDEDDAEPEGAIGKGKKKTKAPVKKKVVKAKAKTKRAVRV